MTETYQGLPLPAEFSGQVRLFPLPNLVMFPHVLQPLHIFEPRYIAMVEAAMEDGRLLAMALLQPGWEADYDGRPSIYEAVCLGRVVSLNQLEGGEYNLLLQGLRRATVVRELPPRADFREAEVAVLEDLYPADGAFRRPKLRKELLACFRRFLPDDSATSEPYDQLNSQRLPLGPLTDIVAYSLELSRSAQQELLAQWNVDLRAEMLLEHLRSLSRDDRREWVALKFPPPFSRN